VAQLPHRLALALLRGLLCIPFVIWLSIIASIFLFKLQIERWLSRPYDDNLSIAGPRATAEAQDRRPQLCGRRDLQGDQGFEEEGRRSGILVLKRNSDSQQEMPGNAWDPMVQLETRERERQDCGGDRC
jgi:hypothetical protein